MYKHIHTLTTATSNGGGGGGIAEPGKRKKRQLDMSTGYNYINIDVVSALREFEECLMLWSYQNSKF